MNAKKKKIKRNSKLLCPLNNALFRMLSFSFAYTEYEMADALLSKFFELIIICKQQTQYKHQILTFSTIKQNVSITNIRTCACVCMRMYFSCDNSAMMMCI